MEILMHEASNRQEISTNPADPKTVTNEKCEDIGELSHVGTHDNNRESVDIIFENVTYTVNLGCKKGELSRSSKCFL